MSRRSRRGDGSLIEVRPGVWRVWISAGYDPATGRRRRVTKTIKANSREEAIRAAERLRVKLEQGALYSPDARITLAEWYETWAEDLAVSGLSVWTVQTYRARARQILRRIGHWRLRDITRPAVQTWVSDLLREGYSPRSAAYLRTVLWHMLDAAVNRGIIPFNPADRVRVRAQSSGLAGHTPADAEVASFLAAARGTIWYLPLRIVVATGMRRSEVLGLRWRDLNWRERTMTVAGTVVYVADAKRTIWRESTKTRSGRRVVYVDDEEVWRLLREQEGRIQQWRQQAGRAWQDHDLIFPSRTGAPRNPQMMTDAVTRIAKRIGMSGRIWTHVLRHYHATTLVARGWPLPEVAQRLGHASAAVTLGIYAHAIPGQQARLAKELGALPDGLRRAQD